MAVAVTTRARTTALATLASVKAAAGITDTAQDAVLRDYIRQASAAIVAYCGRPFAREVVSETILEYTGMLLALTRTPLVGPAPTLTVQNSPMIDFVVDDPDAGTLYRQQGWDSLEPYPFYRLPPLFAADPTMQTPIYATYTAGYLLPDDDVISSGISVDHADDAFVLPTGELWPLLVAGDVLAVAGFGTAANNGVRTVKAVVGQRCQVNEAVTTEAATQSLKRITVQTLPGDVERTCVETAASFHYARAMDPAVTSKQVGDLRIDYARAGTTPTGPGGLPPDAMGRLAAWVRYK